MFSSINFPWLYNGTVYGYYSDLQVNQVIKYSYHFDNDNSLQMEGGFYDALTGYQGNVSSLISTLVNSNNQQVFLEREKIVRPAYGQHSDYEAEMINPASNYPGYGWLTRKGTPYYNDIYGVSGIYLSTGASTDNGPDWVLEDLYENEEQVNYPGSGSLGDWGYSHGYYLSDNKMTINNDWKWYVLPRMRINQADAFGTSQNVVTVEARNYQGNVIASVTISTSNFRNPENINQYDGRYLDKFTNPINYISVLARDLNQGNNPLSDGRSANPNGSQVDYKIYWHGEVDVWIDRVRVEDEWAHFLFDPVSGNPYDFIPKIQEETNGLTNDPFFFYQDEFQYNQIPCIAAVDSIIKLSNPQNGLISLVNDWWLSEASGLKNPPPDFSHYVTRVMPPALMVSAYPFDDYVKLPPNVNLPNTITYPGTQNYVTANTNQEYNTALQSQLDNGYHLTQQNGFCLDLELPSYMGRIKKAAVSVAGTPVPFIFNSQVHAYEDGWENAVNCKPFVSRDQTAPEMGLLPQIALCYGAKQISYWWLPSFHVNQTLYNTWGLLERTDWQNTPAPRYTNYFGEQKWNNLIALNQKLNILGNILFPLQYREGFSVHLQGSNYSYVSDILSIDPHQPQGTQNPCVNDNQTSGFPYGPYLDCPDERYWELGFFDDPMNAESKYVMAVNRRCTPVTSSPYNAGDSRVLKIKFNGSNLPGSFVNWKITNVLNNSQSAVFSRYYNGYFDLGSNQGELGWFKPGEGKLFKLEAVPISGGTLVADEIITGESFTCEAPVYNNGFNITIGANTTIHFNDSSKFVMSGGVFTVGDQNTSAPQNITSDAVPGGSWRGHSFTNCEVKIYGATFTGFANDTTYAVNIIDCPVVDIRNCTFNTNSSLKGGVNAICFDNPFIAINNIYIGSNTFNSSGSTIPTLNVSSYAGVTTPLIIENNTFNEGNTAVFLSGVIGGAIKGNTITDNYIGINALTSSIDVVQNTISSTVNGSMGIFAAGGSELKLNSSGAFTLGGLNNISNEGTGTNNINVDGSYFLLEGGENIFNISSDLSSYNLYGYFPMFTAVTTEETNNCFKVDGSPVDPPINMVTSGYQGTQITFNFNPYLAGCEIIGGGDGLAINLGDGIYDTIYTGGSGSGGSQKEILPLTKGEYPQGEGVLYTTPTAKTMYDSISVLMRYRNYTQAKTNCLDLINTYPDSIQSIFAVSKLFLATVASDTTYNAVNTLKIYYENLILNHPGNTSLVKRANYYILKCKVRMREYSQALAGFQQIINQNPYSYEGLIARWDYMATSLLIQGQGGAYSSIDNDQLAMNNYDIDGNDDDRKPFTKEQRQDIRKSINTAIEISKSDDETKIKKLEEKSELGDVNASKELIQMKSLKQVVKTEKPKSIIEHVRIVSEDIRKVFGSSTSSKGNEPKNIPLVFRLSQNYPNPFNPVTKINYDLPKDSKVKIVIYDILGREVKRLVNNELKTAGSYIVDFNASNYASGVYFYRIEAEEPNGNKFVDSKKMVLLK